MTAELHASVTLVALAGRERVRAQLRAALPRRRARLVLVKTADDFHRTLHTELVDAALVDVATVTDDVRRVIACARDYPSTAFFAVAPLRAQDAAVIATCVAGGFADLLVDGIDDAVIRDLVFPQTFTRRFAAALDQPPAPLGLTAPLQQATWRALVASGGRPVRVEELADALGVTREHLSRTFSAANAPNLKRVIDLVRLVAAAEIAKNPGYDVGDVARLLGFASSSHLSTTAQRILGTRPSSLARLRTVDLFDRFSQGRGRSRSGSLVRRRRV